ncbi:MalY/PatB family protein [Streptomyces sp. CA-132043]|uniref:MalY/PatB family protein n=1 Tax=Streptomyces sp. CA-132043 TaxID=3240048 RepID=UPI003D91F041
MNSLALAAQSKLDFLDLRELSQRDGEKWAHAGPDVLASWVADMDFPTAPAIREAVARRAAGDLGYPMWFDESDGGPLGEVFAERTWRRYGHAPDPTHVRLFTDVNQALLATLQLATSPGDSVLLHTPACPPFVEIVERLGRTPLTVPIEDHGAGWEFDPGRMESAAAAAGPGRCRALFLVNPHNPTGRVFRRTELESLAELALRHDLLVISDEVHADLTHAPHQHIPFASLGPEVAARTVTLTSGSKAFNLAGVRCAVAHIGPKTVREALDSWQGMLFGQVGVLAVEALKAAWTSGDAWLAEVKSLLDLNRRRVAEHLPDGLSYRIPEAGFLAWLDCRGVEVGDDPMPFFRDRAKVLLFSGPAFGTDGNGFVRLNFGTSPSVLDETLTRMRGAVAHKSK